MNSTMAILITYSNGKIVVVFKNAVSNQYGMINLQSNLNFVLNADNQ